MEKTFKNFVSENEYLTKLAKAVYKQIGADNDEDFFDVMDNVAKCSCGAAGGFSGFVYYTETTEFWRQNKTIIKENMKELADSCGDGSVIEMVMNFNGVKGYFTEDEVGRALYGNYDPELTQLYNVFAWYALEEVANRASIFVYSLHEVFPSQQ